MVIPTRDWLTRPWNFASDSRSARFVFSFSLSAASNSAVRRRTCSSKRIACWKRLKLDTWTLVLRSARSVNARTILVKPSDLFVQSNDLLGRFDGARGARRDRLSHG